MRFDFQSYIKYNHCEEMPPPSVWMAFVGFSQGDTYFVGQLKREISGFCFGPYKPNELLLEEQLVSGLMA